MKEKENTFDFNEAVQQLLAGKKISGKDGVLAPLVKQLVEAALEAEVESHITADVLSGNKNRKNGKTSKTIKSTDGTFELNTPRDRAGSFEPQIIKKNQTTISNEIEERIISMYGLGMSYKDIIKHIEEIYRIELSTATNGGKYVTKAVYTVLGMGIDGKKDILGLYLSESEGANFWLSVLTDLNNRGVEDILIASVDGLKGFPEAIKTIFPKTEVQLCVVHQIRNSLKYVASKDQKEFMKDLKLVYQATTKDIAEEELQKLDDKWSKKYPIVLQSWQNKWENLSYYFKYPKEIRKIMYTTNIIESVHRQFRKLTKTKGAFPNENSLLKLLYMGIINAKKKWTQPVHNWSLTISQLAIFFEGRLDDYLEV